MAKNKTGKYFKYAIGEIILVVIGILIALQINNWNEQAKLKIEESRLLAQLNSEFKTNKRLLEEVNTKNEKNLKNLDKILAFIPINIKTVNLDSISHYINESYNFNTYDPVQGTINELINNSFQVISNKKLRSLLLEWNSIKEDFRDDELFAIDFAVNHYFPKLQSKVSIDFGLKKPGTDLSFLQSIEFENTVRGLNMYYINIVGSSDYNRLATTIDQIIELSELTE